MKGDPTVDKGEIAKRQKNIDALNTKLKETAGKITSLKSDNTAAQKVIDELQGLNVELDKIPGQSANSLLGNLKERFTKLDGWTDLGNTIGGLVSAGSGIHK